MPQYNCRMLTPQGQIIKSKVEEASRLACIRRLRRNGFTPISVVPAVTLAGNIKSNAKSKKMRNVRVTNEAKRKLKNKTQTNNKNKKAQGRYLGDAKQRFRWWWKKTII